MKRCSVLEAPRGACTTLLITSLIQCDLNTLLQQLRVSKTFACGIRIHEQKLSVGSCLVLDRSCAFDRLMIHVS